MTYVGRLAPSPTGAQHLGNARTYVIAWLLARSQGGKLLLRIEDLDTPRTKLGAEQLVLEDLEWLGLDWDRDDSPRGYALQSERTARYTAILDALKRNQRVYACRCTRSDLEQASSAPHESLLDGLVYPETCRLLPGDPSLQWQAEGTKFSWRFRLDDEVYRWTDLFRGDQELAPRTFLGDFVVARNYGPVAYQLAVVIDDHDSGITDVVRGDDLVYSTYRQIALYRALGWESPRWCHVPLVVGADGKRLAKRHGDTRLQTYREMGVPASRVLGLIASSLAMDGLGKDVELSEMLHYVKRMPDWLSRSTHCPLQLPTDTLIRHT